MKLNEFEEKLATVPDAKLRQMLTAARASGPEVAVNLLLSECNRRGMEDLDAEASGPLSGESRPGAETLAYAQENAGYAGSDAPPSPPSDSETGSAGEGSAGEAPNGEGIAGEAPDGEAPAVAPDWLNEETKSGLPMAVKILLVLIVLGAILVLALKFSR